jgi:DNA recombination protein RmuC
MRADLATVASRLAVVIRVVVRCRWQAKGAARWRQEKIAGSAREIAAAGRELHKRIATFLEPYAKLGRQLNSAVNAYNQGVGSLDARVLPQLRRLDAAGAGSEKALPPLAGLDTPAKVHCRP